MQTLPPAAAAALERLLAGNTRMLAGQPLLPPDSARRSELAEVQTPFAAILACVDSRVIPELVFHQDIGNLIVARVPGNTLDDDAIAALEFAVAMLGAPLAFVLGHTGCGAMQIAIDSVHDRRRPPGHLAPALAPLLPAVRRALGGEGDWLDNAVAENVRLVVQTLPRRSPLLRAAVKKNAAGIAGGVYDLRTGVVTRLL